MTPTPPPEALCAFVCILKDYRKVEDLLLALLDLGVPGATVVEGRGMGQIIGGEMPAFAGVRGQFPGSAVDSNVVFCVTSARQAQRCLALVDRVCGPLTDPGHGIAFVLPVIGAAGLTDPA